MSHLGEKMSSFLKNFASERFVVSFLTFVEYCPVYLMYVSYHILQIVTLVNVDIKVDKKYQQAASCTLGITVGCQSKILKNSGMIHAPVNQLFTPEEATSVESPDAFGNCSLLWLNSSRI